MKASFTFLKCLVICCFMLSIAHSQAATLSGNYTIDSSQAASATNFKNFASAKAFLTGVGLRTDGGTNNSAPFGVSGPVVFNVAAGTFSEQVTIGNIAGASATNTVTFNGGNGNASSRVLTFAATTSGSRYTFQLNNAQYVSIRNLTIRATGGTYGWALHITGANADYNKVKNCVIEITGAGTTSTSANYGALIVSGSGTGIDAEVHANYLEIDSNIVNYGRYGISVTGSYNDKGTGNKFRGNIISNASLRGMNLSTQNGIIVERNTISMRSVPATGTSAIYCMGIETTLPERAVINANRITGNLGAYGMYFNSCSNDALGKGLVSNNFIGGGHKLSASNGISMTGSNNWIFAHNTLNFDAEGTANTHGPLNITYGCNDISLVNNILSNTKTGPATVMYIEETGYFDQLDNNLYYKAGSNRPVLTLWGASYTGTSYIGVGGFNLKPAISLPGFVNDTNLHISEGCRHGKDLSSYSTDSVISLYLSKDIDGNTRALASGDMGADEYIPFGNDLAIVDIVSPTSPATPGPHDFVVSVRNNGSNVINAFNVTYTQNNGTPVQYSWTGVLNPCESDSIIFDGARQINIAPQNNIVAYVSMAGDLLLKNDTLIRTIYSGLNGNYTIGGPGADYATFTAAVNDLKQRGVTGHVTFSVTAGTYTEQVSLNEQVAGASSVNTITFDGISSANRIIAYSTSTSASRHTFLIGSSYVILKNLTIRSTGTGSGTFGWPVHITGNGLKKIFVKQCVAEVVNAISTSQNYSCIVISGSGTSATTGVKADSLEIDSNTTKGGYYGIACSGVSSNLSLCNQFRYNNIDSSHNTSLYIQNHDGINIDHNKINRRAVASSGEGIRLNNVVSNMYRTIINGNIIRNKGGSGIYIENSNQAADRKGICTNNMVGGNLRTESTYGIQLNSSNYWYICHNTALNDFPNGTSRDYSVFTANGSFNLTLLNNIFTVSAPSFSLPLYSNSTAAFDTIDYNLYYRADTANHELIYIGGSYNGNIKNAPNNMNAVVKPARFISNTDLRITEACNNGIELSTLFSDPVLLSKTSVDIFGNPRTTTPDMGASEYSPAATDLIVTGIVSPAQNEPFAAGNKDLVVAVQNNGTSAINSFDVKYNNNGTIVSETWNTPLAPCETATITFTGAKQINLSSVSNLAVYTELSGDVNYANDTFKTIYTPGLSGNYTIGTTGNYPTFTAAANALKQGGVLGPVTFTVAPGTYTEQLNLSEQIRGVSAINTITFDGVDSATRIIDYYASSSNLRYTLWLGTSYVRIKNLTIRASGNYGWPVFISNTKTGTTNIEITKCVMDITNAAGKNPVNEDFVGLVISSSITSAFNSVKADSITLDSNTFNYGYYGIAGYGLFDKIDYSMDCRIRGNKINHVAGSGISISNHANLKVEGNIITISKTSNSGTGIDLSSLTTTPDERNVIKDNIIYNTGSGGSGISIYQCENNDLKGILANNVISGGFKAASGFGIRINQSTQWYVMHNSVNKDFAGGTNSEDGNALWVNTFSNTPSRITVMNNIFAVSKNSASLPLFASGANLFDTLDYNIYYKSDTSSSNEIMKIDGSSYTVFNLIGGGGYNTHSSFRVPGFINDTNLHMLQQNACANRFGFATTDTVLYKYIGHDIDGESRIATPIIGADEIPAPHTYDLSITKLVSPSNPFSPGLQDIKVVLTNVGSATLFSAMVTMEINNDPPSGFMWTGTLQQCDTTSFTIPVQANMNAGVNTIKIYSSLPNFITDENMNNDTLKLTLQPAMEGLYTIGSDVTDSFPNFTSATSALSTRGVSGNVHFNIRAGSYNEYILLNAVQGASLTNSITFEAQHRDSVFVRYNSTSLHPNVLTLFGASYITFKNISFAQQNATNYNALYLTALCSYDTFENCRFTAMTPTVNLNYSVYGVDLSGAGLTFKNNLITGGGGGVYLRGLSAGQVYRNMVFANNNVQNTYFATVDIRFQDSLLFANNYVALNGSRANNNNYLLNCDHSLFANNVVIGSDFVNEPQFQVFGNSLNSHIYHNSFNLKNDNGAGPYIMNSASKFITVRNNIFNSRGSSYAVTYSSLPGSTMSADNNSYYTSGDLIRTTAPSSTYSSIQAWKAASAHEKHSVSYRPGFAFIYDLIPDATDSASWSVNGRALHLDTLAIPFGAYLSHDAAGIKRAATYADGAPDMGAYEFTPTAIPPAATAVPSNPVAGSTQVFTFAGDTVAYLTWDQFAAVPPNVTMRQYSGVTVPNIGTHPNYMFFYLDAQIPAGSYNYFAEVPYLEGWKGTLPDENNARFVTYKASTLWQFHGSSAVDSMSNRLSGYFNTDWNLITGTDFNNPLPVKLLSFTGKSVKKDVLLEWATATEVNNNGFEVQRSIDGKHFETIGFVKGNGNTSSAVNYSYTDINAFSTQQLSSSATPPLYYRLKQLDRNGTASLSHIVIINSVEESTPGISFAVYPNPFSDKLTIDMNMMPGEHARLQLVDIQGRAIRQLDLTSDAATGYLSLSDLNDIKEGIYFLSVETALDRKTIKLVKTSK